jgi:putative NIF3 family GTP cyclohydrolase 1 type 2
MNLGQFYKRCIEAGIQADPRGKAGIERYLKAEKKRYEALEPFEKENYDHERLTNPYTDVRILNGDPDEPLRGLMVGIDAYQPELILAEALRRRGEKVNVVLTHHPAGFGIKRLPEVLDVATEQWISLGVPPHIAQRLNEERCEEVVRRFHVANSDAAVDAARLLGMPYMCSHTAADNWVAQHLQKKIDTARPDLVSDVLELLYTEPEYRHQARLQAPPMLVAGKKTNRCGRVFVEMTGGVMPKQEAFDHLSRYGISTLVVMHMPEEALETVKKASLNVIIAGHMASDTMGMNLMLDKALPPGDSVMIFECAGFKRFDRRSKAGQGRKTARTQRKGKAKGIRRSPRR